MIYRTAPFSMTLNDPYPHFQGRAVFDAEYLRNGTTYTHSFDEILIGTYTRPTQRCHFERPWVSLSDLAKYSMTRSVARSHCDSWASCFTKGSPDQSSYIKGRLHMTIGMQTGMQTRSDDRFANRSSCVNSQIHCFQTGRLSDRKNQTCLILALR